MNVFPAINVTLGPAILVLSLQDFNFQDPSLAESCSLISDSTCRELKFASVKAVISASIQLFSIFRQESCLLCFGCLGEEFGHEFVPLWLGAQLFIVKLGFRERYDVFSPYFLSRASNASPWPVQS